MIETLKIYKGEFYNLPITVYLVCFVTKNFILIGTVRYFDFHRKLKMKSGLLSRRKMH